MDSPVKLYDQLESVFVWGKNTQGEIGSIEKFNPEPLQC